MDLTIDLFPTAGRYPLPLTDRWTIVAMVPIDGMVVLGFVLDGEPLYLTDEPAGEA